MLIDVDWCWLMLIDIDWCWLMLIDAYWCWSMLIDANWLFNQVFFCRSIPPEFLWSFYSLLLDFFLCVPLTFQSHISSKDFFQRHMIAMPCPVFLLFTQYYIDQYLKPQLLERSSFYIVDKTVIRIGLAKTFVWLHPRLLPKLSTAFQLDEIVIDVKHTFTFYRKNISILY